MTRERIQAPADDFQQQKREVVDPRNPFIHQQLSFASGTSSSTARAVQSKRRHTDRENTTHTLHASDKHATIPKVTQ